MRSKALNPAENELVTRMIQQILDEDFGGVVVRTAKALGVSHATIFDLLSGKRGAGMHLLTALANYRRIPIEQILGRATLSGTSSLHGESEPAPGPLTQAIEANVEIWKYGEDVAKALRAVGHRNYSAEQWVILGNFFDQALGNAELFASGERRTSQKKQAAR